METLKENLKKYLRPDVDWEFDEDNNKIDVYSSSNWTAENEQQYKHFENLIDNYKLDNDLFTLTAWCDISGYHYWVVQQEESNYVSIDVVLKKNTYSVEEIREIEYRIIEADIYFLETLTQFQYGGEL
jgi:hypothetical protein